MNPIQAIERLWQLSEGDERFTEPLDVLERALTPMAFPKQDDLQKPAVCQLKSDGFVVEGW